MVHVGLVGRIARDADGARLTERLLIAVDPAVGGMPVALRAPRDRWNLRVRRVRANGHAESKSRAGAYRRFGAPSANRVTERWKLELNGTTRNAFDQGRKAWGG